MVNPWIRYQPPDSTQLIDGVAINLKALLRMLDKHKISHSPEKMIRRQLKMQSQVQTHSHHCFLPAGHPGIPDISNISKKHLTAQYGCVCIPQGDVPTEFTKHVMEQGYFLLHCVLWGELHVDLGSVV